MKKYLLLLPFCVFTFSILSAQVTKGTIFLGGSLAFSDNDNESGTVKQENKQLVLSPSAGFAIKDHLVIGAGVNYGRSTYEIDNNESGRNTTKGLELFIRKYIPLGRSFYLTGNAEAFYNNLQQKSTTSSAYYKNEINVFGLGASPGLSYALNPWFHLEASMLNLVSVSYSTTKQTSSLNTPIKSSSFTIVTNFNGANLFNIGFRIILPKKEKPAGSVNEAAK